jgi:hypothetical protein
MQRPDGSVWINSFAHGRTTYELKHDQGSVEAEIRAADPSDAASRFIQLSSAADLAPDDELRLRDLVCELSGTTPRALGARI